MKYLWIHIKPVQQLVSQWDPQNMRFWMDIEEFSFPFEPKKETNLLYKNVLQTNAISWIFP